MTEKKIYHVVLELRWILFSVIGETYFIKYITNNHVSGQYIF